MILVMGGSCSGKSSFAEELMEKLAAEDSSGVYSKYYIATMEAQDGESLERIARHRRMRAGKGFVTIEQGRDIARAVEQMEDTLSGGNFGGRTVQASRAGLLECMSNLVANEMFGGEEILPGNVVSEKIGKEIDLLSKSLRHLVIVTNNVFEDGVRYDEATMEYLDALGKVNQKIAAEADRVYEVVVGIPLSIKG